MVLLETRTLIYYLPVLAVSGVVAGVLIGILGDVMIKRLRKIQWMGEENWNGSGSWNFVSLHCG